MTQDDARLSVWSTHWFTRHVFLLYHFTTQRTALVDSYSPSSVAIGGNGTCPRCGYLCRWRGASFHMTQDDLGTRSSSTDLFTCFFSTPPPPPLSQQCAQQGLRTRPPTAWPWALVVRR